MTTEMIHAMALLDFFLYLTVRTHLSSFGAHTHGKSPVTLNKPLQDLIELTRRLKVSYSPTRYDIPQ